MDSDTAGVQSASDTRIMTRKYLFDRISGLNFPNIEEKLNFFKADLLSYAEYTEDETKSFKRSFAHFKCQIKQRWLKAHNKEDVFRKYNDVWLQGSFGIPVPSQGWPSERLERRKTKEDRSTFNKGLIDDAAQNELHQTEKRDASDVVKEIAGSPTHAKKYKKASDKSTEEAGSLTPLEALAMFVDADLTRRQYKIIRNTNKKFFPSYSLLVKAKEECIPSQKNLKSKSKCRPYDFNDDARNP